MAIFNSYVKLPEGTLRTFGHHKNKHLETHLKVIATVALIVSKLCPQGGELGHGPSLSRSSSEM